MDKIKLHAAFRLRAKLEQLGKSIKHNADPYNYHHTQREASKLYQRWLPIMRELYSKAKHATSEAELLKAVQNAHSVINTGLEGNALRLIEVYLSEEHTR